MPDFTYVALDRSGSKCKGKLEAVDQAALCDELHEKGQYLLRAREIRAATTRERMVVPRREYLVLMTSHVCTMLNAGVSLIGAFEALADQELDRGHESLLRRVARDLAKGKSFAEALEAHPRVFSKVYVGVVRAGETSGQLQESLSHLARYLHWQEELAKSLKRAATYPAVLLSAIVLLSLFLLVFVVPRFKEFISEIGGTTPDSAKVLFVTSDFVRERYELLIAVAGAAGLFLLLSPFLQPLRRLRDSVLLSLPVIGVVCREIALARFARNLSLLTRSGINLPEAMDLTRKLVGNARLEAAIGLAGEQVLRGESMTESLAGTRAFPAMVLTMVRVGEISGGLSEVLGKVNDYYEAAVRSSVERAMAVVGPVLTICLGALVAWIAGTVFTTLYSVLGQVGEAARG